MGGGGGVVGKISRGSVLCKIPDEDEDWFSVVINSPVTLISCTHTTNQNVTFHHGSFNHLGK